MHAYTHTHTNAHTHMHMLVHMHMHTHMHMHMHSMCIQVYLVPKCTFTTLPHVQESELLHVGVLLAGRLEASLWVAFALAAARLPPPQTPPGTTERLQRRTKVALPPPAGPVREGQD